MNNKPVALVTGAGQGIVRGIAIELAKNGFDIIGNDCIFNPENKQKGLFEVKARVEELDAVFLPVQGDISSISAEVSSPSRAEYCISKAALSQAARIFADRLCEYGINVYEIRPGIIKTQMTAPVQEKYDKLIQEGLVPQQRWGAPEDIGKAVVAFAKGYFDYSTGLIVEVSGGMNIRRL